MSKKYKVYSIILMSLIFAAVLVLCTGAAYTPKWVVEDMIRTVGEPGIRFSAQIDKSLRDDERLEEYGFIVVSRNKLVDAGQTISDFGLDSEVEFKKGINYGTAPDGKKIDVLRDLDDTSATYSCVIHSIPREHYDSGIVAKAYLIYDGETYYSPSFVISYRAAASDVQNSDEYEKLDEESKAVIDGILSSSDDGTSDDVPSAVSSELIIPIGQTEPKLFEYKSGSFCYYILTWHKGRKEWVAVGENNEILDFSDGTAKVSEKYADKLCTARHSIGGDVDFYEFELLTQKYAAEDFSALDGLDSNGIFVVDTTENVEVTRVAGNRYDIGFERLAVMSDCTKIVVREYYKDTDSFDIFEYTSFEDADIELFDKAAYVLSNNVDSKAREYLVAFYGIKVYETDPSPDVPGDSDEPEENERDYEAELDKIIANPEMLAQNFVIPTRIEEVKRQYDSGLDATICYIYAYVDEYVEYIPISLDGTSPSVLNETGTAVADEYNEQLCAYVIDENGLYHLRSLGYGTDAVTGLYNGIEKTDTTALCGNDENAMFFVDYPYDACAIKVGENKYELDDYTCCETVTADENTVIVIRYFYADDDEYEYVIHSLGTFLPESGNSSLLLDSLTYVLSNNTSSETDEKLVILYATVTDEVSDANDDVLIVSNHEISEDDNGNWRYFYELYDIKNCTKLYDIMGIKTAAKASGLKNPLEHGTILHGLSDGLADDTKEVDETDIIEPYQLVWISEAYEDSFAAVPVDDTITCKECIKEYVENYNGGFMDIYETRYSGNDVGIRASTEFYVMEYSSLSSLFKWGTLSKTSLSDFVEREKNLLCYNEKAEDENGNYKTKRADFIKAYISTTTDSYGSLIADFVIVVVNGDEGAALDEVCSEHGGESDSDEESLEYRIVSGNDSYMDENGKWRHYYELYNPYTGSKEYDIPSSNFSESASELPDAIEAGTVILCNGKNVDKTDVVGTLSEENLVHIGNVKDDGTLVAAPFDGTISCPVCLIVTMDRYISGARGINDILGNKVDNNFIPVTENTVYSVLEFDGEYGENVYKAGHISLADAQMVLSKDKTLLCYNSKAQNSKGEYVTWYAYFMKAFVCVGQDGTADFVLLVVNDGDLSALRVNCERDDGYATPIPSGWK